jgi:serine/threonine-protein kinase
VVKLVDFGIAKAELRETRTRSGTIKGKFAYMSPEQCVANNVDRRTDVFALGVIGHELLTGRRLFKRPSPYETYQAVMECDVRPPSLSDPVLDPAIDAVIMGALTKDRDHRYPTAEAFGDALLGYLHHRGIGSGPGDVSRFFDAYFAQEIEEHSGRMRELIAGRDVSVDSGVSWGGEDGRDSDPLLGGDPSAGSSSELTASRRLSAASFSLVFDDLGHGSRGESDDEMPAERTRIESNPMERVNELERLAAQGGRAPADGPTQLAPSSAVPVPPPPPGVEASAQRASAAQPPTSGRFPDAANLPTVIGGAEPLGLTPSPRPAADPPAALPAHARTQIAPMPVASPPGPPGNGIGYPVMNAELSAQIATGASVFPSDPVRTGSPHPAPSGHAMPAMQPGSAMPSGPHGSMGATMPSGPLESMGSAMPSGPHGSMGSPMLHGAHEPGALPGPPVPGPRGSEPGGGYDPQRAAELMSPVGQYYPEPVDWSAAAAGRARALPPWMLAVLFIGAIGIALALTIVVARLIR